ncbi:MAG: competence/damage-inducible protein A [Sulfurimonas sp.]|nr:competence/damage-inducible protein A [Sulfurimonas sp.]
MNFYALIIGTEILNARREDKHFKFLQSELAKYGHELFASFIVKDDEKLMKNIYQLIKNDKDAVLFSFGGIGSTPDDLTREIASEIFTNKKVQRHVEFEKDIIEKFGSEAYPHRIYMADLPPNAKLLFNPINNMSGFSLEDKYFFVPGFPQMAHPMISDVINKFFSKKVDKYRFTLLARTSENTLITLMKTLPSNVELSSLPIFKDNKPSVELSLSGFDKSNTLEYFNLFCKELNSLNIEYKLI